MADKADDRRSTATRFSRAADAYRSLWAPVLHPYAVRLLVAMPLGAARRVLDLGAGVGSMLPDLAKAAPRAVVVGADASTGMLALAPRIFPLVATDAARIALRSSSIDAVTMTFVLFLLPDPIATLKDLRRILRPGGALGVATWSGLPTFPALEIWTEELTALGPPPVRWPTLTHSEAELAALLASGGFPNARTWSAEFLFRSDIEGFIELRTGLSKVWLEGLTPEVRGAFLERVRARLRALPPEGFSHRAVILYATAVRIV
jgi:SAM-dependent methyltransferase